MGRFSSSLIRLRLLAAGESRGEVLALAPAHDVRACRAECRREHVGAGVVERSAPGLLRIDGHQDHDDRGEPVSETRDRARQRAVRPVPRHVGATSTRVSTPRSSRVQAGEQLGERRSLGRQLREVPQELVRVDAAQHLGAALGAGHEPRAVPLSGGARTPPMRRPRRPGRAASRPRRRRPLRVEHDREPSRLLLLELAHHHLPVRAVEGPSARAASSRRAGIRGRRGSRDLAPAAASVWIACACVAAGSHERERTEREHGAAARASRCRTPPRRRRRSATPNGADDRSSTSVALLRSATRCPPARRDLRPVPGRQRWHHDPYRRQELVRGDQSERACPRPRFATLKLDDGLLALVGLGRRVALDVEPAEPSGGQERPGHDGAQQQRREHEEPAGLDVRPDEEQDGRAERAARRPACAGAHGSAPSERRAAGRGPRRAAAARRSRAIAGAAARLPGDEPMRRAPTGRERLHVVGQDVVATLGDGPRLRGAHEPDARARRRAERDLGRLAGRRDERDRVLEDARRRRRPRGPPAGSRDDVLGREHRLEVVQGVARELAADERRSTRPRRGSPTCTDSANRSSCPSGSG